MRLGRQRPRCSLSLLKKLRRKAQRLLSTTIRRKLPVGSRPTCGHSLSVYRWNVVFSKTFFNLLMVAIAILLWAGVILFQQRTRTIEGTWVDLFESSSFFENQTIQEACSPKFWSAPWFAYYPDENTKVGRMVRANRNAGSFMSEYGPYPVAAYSVRFVGRRRVSELLGLAPLIGVGYGHLSAHGSQFEVDRLISIKPIAKVRCDVR